MCEGKSGKVLLKIFKQDGRQDDKLTGSPLSKAISAKQNYTAEGKKPARNALSKGRERGRIRVRI